jgi:phosphomannomutase
MNIFFGTDGWRARLGTVMNEESVNTVAQAFADYLNNLEISLPVAIAFDTRLASSLFAQNFAETLSGNGINVLISDRIIPTPILSFAVKHYGCAAGVMITASHNPPEYNGIKFKSASGGPFSTEETKKVEDFLYLSPRKFSKDNVQEMNFLPVYISHIKKLIDFDAIQSAALPVLVDSMGGAGTTLLETILKPLGCDVKTIDGVPSENFHGRLAEPIEKNLAPLIQQLTAGNYAMGVATDGDADRLGVCMNNGEWLSAQKTILLLVDYLKRVKKVPGGIVKTSSVSDKIRICFASSETSIHEVQVGFKYIADVMLQEEIAFGGEESGGFGYGIHLPERDGIFSALLLIEMLSKSKFKHLSEYADEAILRMGEIYYNRIDMHYDKPDKNQLLPNLYEKGCDKIANLPIEQILTFQSSRGIINGLKFICRGGCRWLLIRSSETEDIIRFYAEGQTLEEVDKLLNAGKALTTT